MIGMSRPESARRASGEAALEGVRRLLLPGVSDERPIDVAERFADLPGLALLESARPGRTGRWSYLSADPVAVLDEPAPGADPFATARALLGRLSLAPADGGPPFLGGLVGYLAYDLGRRLERLPAIAAADQDLPVLRLALHDWVVAWDRRTGEAWLGGRAVDGDRAGLERRLDAVLARLGGPATAAPATATPETDALVFRSGLDHAAFVDGVEAIRDAIAAGELYQANLARRLEAPFEGRPWPLYRRLRTGDPALFSAYLDLGAPAGGGAPRAILSASPEPFLTVSADGRVATRTMLSRANCWRARRIGPRTS